MSYCAISSGAGVDQIMTSPDGVTWTARSSPTNNAGGFVIAFGANKFVALCYDTTFSFYISIVSSDGGATWTSHSVPAPGSDYSALIYSEIAGLFVAVDFEGDVITSPDGATWTSAATLPNAGALGWRGLADGAGLIVAVAGIPAGGMATVCVATSPDGSTWTNRTSPLAGWNGVCFGGGLFVAVASSNSVGHRVMTSPDGITWTSRTSAADQAWKSVAYGAGLYVAVAHDTGALTMTSPDGIAWTTHSVTDAVQCESIAYANGQFLVARDHASNTNVLTSPDGLAWTTQTTALPDHVYSIASTCGIFISCGNPADGSVGVAYTHTFPAGGASNLYYEITSGSLPPGISLDPATGKVSGTPTTAGTYAFTIKVRSALIMAAGDDGSFSDFKIVITSQDGTTWTRQTTAISDSGWSVLYSPDLGLWVEGTDFATTTQQIQTSPDGLDGNWTHHDSGANGSGQVHKLISGPSGGVVAVYQKSGSAHVMTSTDGSTWTDQTLPVNVTIDLQASVAYSPNLGLYCIAPAFNSSGGGTTGSITSPDAVTWTYHAKTGSALPTPNGMAWGAGLFVMIGGPQGSGEHLYTSPDGATWTLQADPGGSAQGWDGIYYANGRFVAVSRDISTNPNNQAAHSTDGITWTIVATPGSGKKWSAVSFGYSTWIAGDSGFGSTQPLMQSIDNGVTWTLVPALPYSYGFINGVAFGPSGDCFDQVSCSILISGGGTVVGNTWRCGMPQRVANTMG